MRIFVSANVPWPGCYGLATGIGGANSEAVGEATIRAAPFAGHGYSRSPPRLVRKSDSEMSISKLSRYCLQINSFLVQDLLFGKDCEVHDLNKNRSIPIDGEFHKKYEKYFGWLDFQIAGLASISAILFFYCLDGWTSSQPTLC